MRNGWKRSENDAYRILRVDYCLFKIVKFWRTVYACCCLQFIATFYLLFGSFAGLLSSVPVDGIE